MNDDTPRQDSTPSGQPSGQHASALSGGNKVIQPLDPNLKAENPITPVAVPAQSPQSAPIPTAPITPQRVAPNSNSIQPSAADSAVRQPVSVTNNNAGQTAPGDTTSLGSDKKRQIIIILVIALGVYTVLPALFRV